MVLGPVLEMFRTPMKWMFDLVLLLVVVDIIVLLLMCITGNDWEIISAKALVLGRLAFILK